MSDEPGRSKSGERLAGAAALLIAFATLATALAGFLQADVSKRAGDLRDNAEQLSLQALASSQSSQQHAQVELATFERWVEERTKSGSALLASLYSGDDPVRANDLQRDADRWQTIADQTLKLTEIDPEGIYGPEQDKAFPSRYFAAATEESLRLNALQDAADEEASVLDQRAAGYTAILAMLAVSLYLFGLTLAVVGRWLQRGFLAVGLMLLGVGTGWMFLTVSAPDYKTDPEAAAEYARGRVAFITAYDQTGFQEAEAHLTRAIELRPTFARAYYERSDVIVQAASPQRTGFTSIVPSDALRRARADLDRARALGLDNAQTFGSLGFYSFAEGVQSGDEDLLRQSIDYSQRAISLDAGEPIYRLNLGVALTALGRIDEARGAYEQAVARTLYIDDAHTELRQEPGIEEAFLAGGLTDLDMVADYRPDLAEQVRGLKELLVGRVAAGTIEAPTGSPAVFNDVTLDIFPAELQWQANIADYDPQRDTISAQWYYQDAQGLGWAVIPEVSLVRQPSLGSDGRYFSLSPYMTAVSPPSCLPSGEYRVEIYVNGRLAAEGSLGAEFGDYEAYLGRDVTAAFCRPQDWQRRDDRLPGLIDGYTSPDGQRGVYVARYSLPGSLRALSDATTGVEDLTIDSFADWFPATPAYVEDVGTTSSYFMGLGSTAWRWYDYGTGYVRVGGGMDADGAVVLGMVFGEYDWFDGTEPYRILNSMINAQ